MVEKRLVSINPDFFKIASNKTTRKNRPNNENPPPKLKIKDTKPLKEKTSKTIKKNLLNYIRQQQQKNYDDMIKPRKEKSIPEIKPRIDITTSSDFKDSLDYLMKLTKENEKKQHHNQTIRNPIHTPINSPIATNHTNENVSLSLPIEFIDPPPPNSIPIQIAPPKPKLITPQYGCMKNGSLPTYRNWKNQTQKNYNHHTPSIPIPINSVSTSANLQYPSQEINKDKLFKEKVEALKKRAAINPLASSPIYNGNSNQNILKTKIAQINYGKKLEQNKKENKRYIPKRQKTLRRTYRVGKSKVAPKVSVLVSNKTIRKNIYTQALLLKQTPIKEVKRYLIKHGFIRVGSIAPNDILRRMYENAKLVCGELKNHNPDNLLYNFLHNNDEN